MDIREGDKVKVEFTVGEVGWGHVKTLKLTRPHFDSVTGEACTDGVFQEHFIDIRHPAIVEHTPKAIQVGDVFVPHGKTVEYTVRYVNDNGAQVCCSSSLAPNAIYVANSAIFLSTKEYTRKVVS